MGFHFMTAGWMYEIGLCDISFKNMKYATEIVASVEQMRKRNSLENKHIFTLLLIVP